MNVKEHTELYHRVRRHVECCLETGNFNDADTMLNEYEEHNPELTLELHYEFRDELTPR